MKSLSTITSLATTLSTNTSTANVTLFSQLANDSHRRYMEKYFFNEATTTITTTAQQQYYDLPFNFSKLKTGTLTIGVLKWNPVEILTRREWDNMNVFPYYADIPNNFFIWNNSKFALWPIPSTTGNVITFNYKKRVPDLTFVDYAGTVATNPGYATTVSATLNSQTITGAGGTGWLTTYLPATPSLLTNATTSTNAQLPTYTYANGTLGVGATITMSSPSVLQIGGHTLALNDIVLVKDEVATKAAYNGLYKVTTAGTASVATVLTRSTDNDQSAEFVGKGVYVSNSLTTWAITNVSAPTLGTDAITFAISNSALNLNLWLKITSPKGDNNYYQISSIESDTSLTLVNAYQGGTATGASYTIGQMPLLLEDFHDVLVYDSLVTYFTSIVDNKSKADEFRARREEIVKMMEEYSGSKTVNVNLARPTLGENPNLYSYSMLG